MAKKEAEWIKSSTGLSYHIDSWSSDSEKYLLKILKVPGEAHTWVIDVMGIESFLVVDEADVEEIKRLAKVYLRQVLEKIVWTFDMTSIKGK